MLFLYVQGLLSQRGDGLKGHTEGEEAEWLKGKVKMCEIAECSSLVKRSSEVSQGKKIDVWDLMEVKFYWLCCTGRTQ